MWIEELRIENVRCFDNVPIRFAAGRDPRRWITFLSENGGGKSTALQVLGLLLSGPEGALKLLPRPVGMLRDETKPGKISIRIHQGDRDPGQFGDEKLSKVFGYTFFITGSQPITIRNKAYSEPTIVPSGEARLTWLRENALTSQGRGWFAVGYGAFRRLTRASQIIIPSLEPQARYTNFITQFDESEPLAVFERWMVYLDYKIAKEKDRQAERFKEIGVSAINRLLPEGVTFDRVTSEGKIFFDVKGQKVPTISLSDGYRSILAFVGDLIWRLILSFPESADPAKEEGVALIDELDIHLHPSWQRDIAGLLQEQFPGLQFIVATHSPLIAAGAGNDALTLRFTLEEGKARVAEVRNVAAMNVDRILQSEAFGLVSPYSPQTQRKLERFDRLRGAKHRTSAEERELQMLLDFVQEARPIGGPPAPGSLEAKIDTYLDRVLP